MSDISIYFITLLQKKSSPAIEMSIFIHIQYIVLYIPNLEHIIDYMISLWTEKNQNYFDNWLNLLLFFLSKYFLLSLVLHDGKLNI